MPEDRKEEETDISSPVTYSDDADTKWIKKGKRAYYGFKAHISVDAKDGYVLGGHITPANTADTAEFEKLIGQSSMSHGSFIVADKRYCSEKNRAVIKDRYTDGIMHKAARNKPLTLAQHIINRFISSVRYKVEQST